MNIYYEKRAYLHDDFMSFSSFDKSEQLFQPILTDITTHFDNKTVLELACGTGNWTGLIAQLARKVIATDINTSMVNRARKKLDTSNNIVFEYLNIYNVQQLKHNIDTIFSSDLISHIPTTKLFSVIQDLVGILSKNGTIIFLDMLPVEMDEVVKWYTDSEGNNIGIRKLPNDEQYHVIKNYPTRDYFDQLFIGTNCEYVYKTYPELKRWVLTLNLK